MILILKNDFFFGVIGNWCLELISALWNEWIRWKAVRMGSDLMLFGTRLWLNLSMEQAKERRIPWARIKKQLLPVPLVPVASLLFEMSLKNPRRAASASQANNKVLPRIFKIFFLLINS